VKLDATEENSPGWKYAEWELRGVPLRLEIGPKDIEKGQVVLARRDTREKMPTPLAELQARVTTLLDEIQHGLLARAVKFREEHTSSASTWDEFTSVMEGRPGYVIAKWCGRDVCEAEIKSETQATIRNLPFAQVPGGVCVHCGQPAVTDARFAKSY
jgi:prolyl-tRNA synthetase